MAMEGRAPAPSLHSVKIQLENVKEPVSGSLLGLWRAVGRDQAGLANHRLGAGGAQARCLEIRPGLLGAIAAKRPDVEPVGLGQGLRHAGFDLRSEAGKNGESGSSERRDADR
jgi:hypothetical protein